MADCESPLEVESKMVAYRNANCQKGPNTPEHLRLTVESSGMTEQLAERWNTRCSKTSVALVSIVIILFIIVISVMVTKSLSSQCLTIAVSSCPSKWVGYEGKCYYFSEDEGNWTFSQSSCSASHASLVTIENQEEMRFIMKHKEPTDYWIGLKREEGQPWKWADGSIFNGWFEIGANGFCAFLDDDMARSTWCTTERSWICSNSAYTA